MDGKECDNPDMLRDFWRELGGYKDDFEYLKKAHFITTVELAVEEEQGIESKVKEITEYISNIEEKVDKRYDECLGIED